MSCSHFTSCRRGPVPVSSPPRHQPHEPQHLVREIGSVLLPVFGGLLISTWPRSVSAYPCSDHRSTCRPCSAVTGHVVAGCQGSWLVRRLSASNMVMPCL